jgi:flagellar biosynthesis/type III secretory pathway chaperone
MPGRHSSSAQSHTADGDNHVPQRGTTTAERFEQLEEARRETQATLDVQFKRMADLQAQVDQLVALVARLQESTFRR